MKKYFLALAMTILASTGSTANTITSGAGGSWTFGSTWIGGVAPTANDYVIIDAGDIVTMASNITCAGLVINGQLTMNTGAVLTVNGDVSGSGTIASGKSITITGDWTFNGTSTSSSSSLTCTGSNDQTISGKISTSSGDLIINKSAGTVRLGSNLYVGGLFTLTAGTFDASTYLLTVVSTVTLTSGTLRVGEATWAENYSFTATPAAGFTIEYYNPSPTINSSITYKNLIFSGSGTAGASGTLVIQGDLLNTGGGIFNFGSNGVTISGTAAQTIAGFTTTGLVSMTKTAVAATFTGNVSMGGLTINGSGGTLDCGSGLTHTVGGTLTLSAGTLNLNSCSLILNGTATVSSGLVTAGTSSVTYAGTTQTVVGTTYNNVTFAGSGVKTLDDVTAVNGTLTINSGATLATANLGLTINGDFVNNGTLSAGSSDITLGGSANQSLGGFTTTGDILVTKSGGTATFISNVSAGALSYSGNNATVALNPGVTMSIPSGLTIPRPTLATNTFSVGDGTLSTGLVTLGGTLVGTLNTVITIGAGSMSTTGNIVSGGPASMLTFTGPGTLNAYGSFLSSAQGTFTAGTGTVNFNRSGGSQTISPFAYTFNNVRLSVSGTKTLTNATINGMLSVEGAVVTLGTPTFGPASTLKYNTATARTVSSEWVSPFPGSGGVVVDNTGVITLGIAKELGTSVPLTIDSGATLSTAGYQLTFGGNFVNNGTFTAGSSPIVIAGTAASQSIDGFTTTGTITLTKTSGAATFTGDVNGVGLTINGAGGTLNLGAGLTHTFTGTLSLTAGAVNGGSSTLNLDGAVTGVAGTWTPGTGTVNFTSASAQYIPAVSYYDLGCSGAGAKTLDASTTITVGRNWAVGTAVSMPTTASINVAGNITGSGAITMETGSITIGGNWTNNGLFTKGTGTVIYNGASGQTVGALSYNNLTLSGAGVKTAAGTVNVGGAFTNSSTLNMAANTLTLSGTKNNTGGTIRFSGASNGLAVSTGTVEYYGSSQTIGVGTYTNLTINQSSGAASLGGSTAVNGVLAFTNGRLATGVHTLSLGAAATISGAGAAKYVNGNLLKAFSTGAASFSYPIGDASAYTPVDIAFGSITSGGNLTIKTTVGDHSSLASSGINPVKDVNRYWTLTNGGIVFNNYSAAFTFVPADIEGSGAWGSFIVRKYSSSWSATTAGTRTATSTQATGVTAFGDFSIGNQLIDHYAVTASSPQTAGSAFAATVTAQDVLNQTVSDDNTTSVTMTNTGNAQFDSNGDGTFGDNTKTLSGGAFTIQTKDNTAQTINLTAADGNSKTGTRTGITVNPAAANAVQSTVEASPAAIGANGVSTSAITVRLKDEFGNNLILSGGTVTLSATSGTLGAVTDHNDGTYTAVLTSPTVAGSGTIAGTINGSPITSTAVVSYTPGPVDLARSTITASPISVTADGVSTSTITVQLNDAFNNPLTAGAGTVALSTTAGSLGPVTNHNNGTYTAVLTSPTSAGTATVTGTLNGSAITDNEAVAFTPGAANMARSTITASPTSITANGVATSTITVQLKDVNNNNLTQSAGTVALSTTAGTLNSVTDLANGRYTAVLTSPTATGSATISGTLNGSAITQTASVSFIPGAANAAQSTISASPASITADGITTSAITVQLKDAFGNNLTTSGGVVALATTAGSLGVVTDHNDGTYTAVLTSSTSSSTAVVSGTLGGSAMSHTASVTFTPGAASLSASTITVSPSSITANGAATSTISVQLKDVNNNPLTSSAGIVTLLSTAGTVGTVTDHGNGTYSAILTSPTASGSATISGTLNGSTFTGTASVSFTPGAANSTRSTITALPASITADGASTSTITIQLKDEFGNNLTASAGTITLSSTAGSLSAVTDHNDGTYSAVLTASTTVGSALISGTLNGEASPLTATVNFTPGAVNTVHSIITASPASITANGVTTSTIAIQLKDVFDNNLTAGAGTIALSTTAGTLGTVSDHNNGTYTAVLTSPTSAGSATVSGTLNGSALASTAALTFTPGAASLTQSTITASPSSITANGSSLSTITVQMKDAFGNNLISSAGTVALSSTDGVLGSVTDHGDGTYTAVLTSPTIAGSAMVFGTLNGSPMNSTPTVNFTAGAANVAQSTISASPVSLTADGASTSTITVQLKDAFNNDLTSSGGTVVLTSTAGTLSAVTDNANGSYTAVLTAPTVVGSATVSGTLNGTAMEADALVTFIPGGASTAHTTISAAPASITADGASTAAITVQLKDAFNNNLASSAGTIALSTTAGTIGAVTDHQDGTYTAVLTAAVAAGSATVSGTLNGGAITDNASVTFVPGASSVATSTIGASPASITADGVTTSTITVQLKDAQGNNLTQSGGTVVLATTLGTLGSVTDHSNGTYSAVLTSATTAGNAAISGTLNGSAITSTAIVTFTPGAANVSQSLITASPSSITADGTAASTITVQLKDAFGNSLTASAGTVAMSTTAGSLGAVTDHGSGSYSAVLTSSTAVGSARITGTLNGSAITDDAIVAFVPGAASAALSTVTASPLSITANGVTTSTITVQLKDANNNNLTQSGGTIAIHTTAGTLGAVTDNNNGTYTAVLTSSTTAGNATVSGTLDGNAIVSTASVTFVPGPVSTATSTITPSPASITADGVTTSAITVQLKDAFGNNLASSGGVVVLSTTAGTLGAVTDQGNGTYTAVLTSSTTAQNATISGILNGTSLTSTGVVTFTAGAANTAQSMITASPASITADGSSTSTITVQLKDMYGNNLAVGGSVVALNGTAGSLSGVTDHDNGTYTAVLTAPTMVGSSTITGTLSGTPIADNATVLFTVGNPSVARSLISAAPSSITADGVTTSTITVQLKDAFGNDLTTSGGSVTLSTTAGTLGSVTDHANGTYSAVLTSPTASGSATVSGTLQGSAIVDTAAVSFVPGAASAAHSTISASPASITADGVTTSTVTVQLKDANNNNIPSSGGTIALSTTSGGLSAVTDNNNGTYTAVLTSASSVGTAVISGTLNGSAITSTASVSFTVGVASAAQSSIDVSPASITADGVTTATVTVQLKDALGHNLSTSGGTVTLSTTAGTLGSVTDNNNGTYSAVLTSPTSVGTATISGTLNGSAFASTAAVTFTAGAASVAKSTLAASSASITADGISTSTITVQLKDAFNNNLAASGGTVVLSTTDGTIGTVTDNNNGTYTAVLTSPAYVGSTTVSATIDGNAVAATVTVNFIPGSVSASHTSISAAQAAITADGVSTSTIWVQLKDANNNLLETSGGTVTLSSTAGTLGAVTDHANGTYSAVLTSSAAVDTATVSGMLNGETITSTAVVRFVAGAASVATSTIGASPASITADGVTTSTITVQLKDAQGNNLTQSGGTVALSATAGTLGSVTDNNNGTYTAVLTSATTAGGGTISGTLNSSPITSTAVVSFVPGTASLAQSTIAVSSASLTADGSGTSTITVRLKDAHGNNLTQSGGTVVISSTAGTLGAVTDHADGTYSAVLTAPTSAGTASVSATLNGSAFASNASVTFTAGEASVAHSSITASPSSLTANGSDTTTITVQLKDGNNNNLTASGGAVAIYTTAGTLGSVTDHNNGSYSAVLTAPVTVGSASITARLNGSLLTANTTVSFAPGSANVEHAVVSASPRSITADGASTSTITVQLRDVNNNNLTSSGGTVALYTTAGTLGSVTDNNNGSYTAALTSTTSLGTAVVTARLNGSLLTLSDSVSFAVGAASAAHSVITLSADTLSADGVSTATVTVQLKDAFDHNLTASGGTVVVSATAGTIGSVTDHNNGTYSAVLTSPTLAGSAAIHATLNDSTLVSSAVMTFTPTTVTITGNAGVPGATVSWTDGTLKTAVADSSGNYSIVVAYKWSGTVTVSRTGFTFSPETKAYELIAADHTGQNYTADAITYTISGNAGTGGAQLRWIDGSEKTAAADSTGAYAITVSYNWSGVVRPSLTGYMFAPESTVYANVLEAKTAQNYTAVPYVYANVKVFLAGPFSAGAMTTGLSTTKRLPLTSETGYAAATFGYTAKTVDSLPPVGIVDWVLVELRTGTAGTTKAAVQAGFLRSNGQIVDTNGTSMLLFKGVPAGNYYIVIRHRNHLSIMSAAPVAMSASGPLYNFTDSLAKAYGTNPMMALTGGYFGMWAGDVNRNGNVKFTGSQNDRSALLSAIGVGDPMVTISGYLQADLNLDGIAKFVGAANDNTVILRTPGFTDPLRVVLTQVPN